MRHIRTGRHILCKYGGIRIPTPPQIDSKSGRRGALFLFIRITALRTRRNCKFGWIYYSRMRSQWEAHHLAVMRRKQIITCLLQIKKTNSGWLHSKVEQHRLMRSWINLNNFLVSIHVIKQIVPTGIIFPKLNMLRQQKLWWHLRVTQSLYVCLFRCIVKDRKRVTLLASMWI